MLDKRFRLLIERINAVPEVSRVEMLAKLGVVLDQKNDPTGAQLFQKCMRFVADIRFKKVLWDKAGEYLCEEKPEPNPFDDEYEQTLKNEQVFLPFGHTIN